MIAVDTNILIYAHRRDSEFHEAAANSVRSLAEERRPWAIAWPCVHEFLAITTHPRIYDPPSRLDQALYQVDVWSEAPTLEWLGETPAHWQWLRALVSEARIVGPKVHDARIAALCLSHGVTELWSADRDFSRFGHLKVRNPLVAGA
jgi:uncharacterized protein